jgi:hypothetical protein
MLSRSQPDALASQRLEAASILWQFVQIGHLPDIRECLDALEPLLRHEDDITESIKDKRRLVRRDLREDKQRRAQGEPATPAHISDVTRSVAAIGDALTALPLFHLAAVARDADLFSTERQAPGTEQVVHVAVDRTTRISYRFFRYPTAPGAVSARLMSRGLSLSLEKAQAEIRALSNFVWRTPEPGRIVSSGFAGFHEEGTRGGSDLRLVAPPDAPWEVEIASGGSEEALSVLSGVVDAAARACAPMPQGGVAEAVRSRLQLSP